MGSEKEDQWNELFEAYKEAYPELANELSDAIDGKVLIEAKDILTFDTEKEVSTRVASGKAINHFVKTSLQFLAEVQIFQVLR